MHPLTNLLAFGLALIAIHGASRAAEDASKPSTPPITSPAAPAVAVPSTRQTCESYLNGLPHASKITHLAAICAKFAQLNECTSVNNEPIFHFDKIGASKPATPGAKPAQKILVFALTHGDEEQSASVALSWMNRLMEFQPRNSWRVIPILNPDGWKLKTRTNANGVDVNRNFPSQDWDELAVPYWKTKAGSADRRFPGPNAASEPETRCAMKHIEEFQPDFIISIHTPLGVLDFDGPKLAYPKFQPLPWVSLGNFPGSLGRYMWVDRKIPVLTVELKSNKLAAKQLEQFDRLQDVSGTVAQQAEQVLKKERASKPGNKSPTRLDGSATPQQQKSSTPPI